MCGLIWFSLRTPTIRPRAFLCLQVPQKPGLPPYSPSERAAEKVKAYLDGQTIFVPLYDSTPEAFHYVPVRGTGARPIVLSFYGTAERGGPTRRPLIGAMQRHSTMRAELLKFGRDQSFVSPWGMYTRSRFCVMARGTMPGQGRRLITMLMAGCIPLILCDYCTMPFEVLACLHVKSFFC